MRQGDIGTNPLTAKGFDTGFHFMLFEIDGDQMHFQTISDLGKTIDSGVVTRNKNQANAPANAPPATVTTPNPITPADRVAKPAPAKPAPAKPAPAK